MLFAFVCFVCLWVLVCGVFNVLVRCVCDLSCDVAWVDFVFVLCVVFVCDVAWIDFVTVVFQCCV